MGAAQRDPLVEIEVGIRGDTAASLGKAGRRLESAVLALATAGARADRKALLYAAADALWAYVVQREAMGLTDNAGAIEQYGVTAELWRLMGAALPRARN